ncbi:hypothetical protein AABB24_024828, partial [Solanum stoloniferum]
TERARQKSSFASSVVRFTGRMIKAVMVINTFGKPRLSKFYEFQPVEKQQELIRHVYAVLSNRPDNVSNFIRSLGAIFSPDTSSCISTMLPYILSFYLITLRMSWPCST